ncbi:putative MATE family efflux protein [Salirhabdus euzebyi]|uniref:Putative MATE family efflux protein n=1 Tax=Salirhabdus euzebyi TaxID=394506 RepID=A0A841Q5L8_9BACI|nr:MATE family efflux transporter [Salirhabdus euzebyi]MBB6453691.1 putative MATE family efflux protein [Salirhabdus euzebyi]
MSTHSNNTKKLTLFAITWPIFIELLLHMLMGSADTLMLSQYSDKSVAAVGVSNQILQIIIVMFGFVATGTGIIIAQYIGANKHKSASEVTSTPITVNLLFGVALSLVLVIFADTFLNWMGLPNELMAEARSYLQIVGGFSFIQALIMTCSVVLRNYGFTKDAMYVTLGMNIINVFGNFVLIFGVLGFPELGVTGVAISTVISRAIGLVVLFFLVLKRMEVKLPIASFFHLPKAHMKNILEIGVPAAGEHLAYVTSQMVIMYFINMMGTESITAKVYTQNLMMFIFLFSVAVGQGTQILVGHHVGAKENQKAFVQCIRSLRIAMLISFLMGILFTLLADSLFGIFTDNQDIITIGAQLLFLTIILEPGRAFNLVVIGSLRAAGDVRFPVYMGILSMWGVSVTLSYFLGIVLGLGLIGIWISFIADEWLRGLIMLRRWKSRVWERKSFVGNR